MNLDFFISRRMGSDSKSIMTRVATIAVAVGLVVMIITIAVIAGFKTQISQRLSALSGHIVVTDVVGVNPASRMAITQDAELEDIIIQSGATRFNTYILRGAIAKGGNQLEGVVVKGVDSLYNSSLFEGAIVEGHAPQFGTSAARRELLVSQELASDMDLHPSQRLELLFSDEDGDVSRLTFKVAGVFSIGVGENEKGLIIADIQTLRRLNGWAENQISGYEVEIANPSVAQDVASELNKKILYSSEQERTVALSLQELYPALFDWLATHDINGVVVGVIMLVVAIFNMATALLIMVLERARMVGILKSIGMDNGSLGRIFLWRAGGIILRGLAWGNIIGIALCLVQQRYELLKLEASGYILSVVPCELEVWWIVALNIGFAGVVLIVMSLPVRMVASISPDEIVKYR